MLGKRVVEKMKEVSYNPDIIWQSDKLANITWNLSKMRFDYNLIKQKKKRSTTLRNTVKKKKKAAKTNETFNLTEVLGARKDGVIGESAEAIIRQEQMEKELKRVTALEYLKAA